MFDSLDGYLDNIAAAATQMAANGGPLAELAAILELSADTFARHQLEIKRLTEHINALKRKVHPVPMGLQYQGGTIFLLASIAKRLAERRRT